MANQTPYNGALSFYGIVELMRGQIRQRRMEKKEAMNARIINAVVTIAPGEESEGNAFGSVSLCVCL